MTLNDAAGKPAKTVMIVHEDGLFGSGLAKLLHARAAQARLRGHRHDLAPDAGARHVNNVALQIKAKNPDLVIPASYYDEFVLLARTMQQQRVEPKGIYSVLNGAASNYRFVKEFPDAANYIIDCNHWFDPRNAKALALKKQVEAMGQFFTYNVDAELLRACCCWPTRIERAGRPTAPRSSRRWRASTFGDHFMPYGPTKFVNGQNMGAAPVNTQVSERRHQGDLPGRSSRTPKPVFPMPALTAASPRMRTWCGRCMTRARPASSLGLCRVSACYSPVIVIPAILNGLMTGRGLCAGRAGADADLRRAAHHQLRARRAADGGDVRGFLRLPHARARPLSSPPF